MQPTAPASSDLEPAAGRTVVKLGPDWYAVILEPLPGAAWRVVGFFRAGNLEAIIDEPAEAQRVALALLEGTAQGAQGEVSRAT